MHHHVRKQALHVTVDSEALALALQPRLQDLNREAFLPAIERVFDDLSLTDRHIFLARLDIDLGTVSKADLDQVGARFERKLREVLKMAIDRVERQPSSEGRVQPDEHTQLEVLERYLLTGTLPFWVPASTFTLADWIEQLSTTAPDDLIDLLRRRRLDARVLERMAQQLGEEPVQRLLRPLGPPDDERVREVHRTDRQAFVALLRGTRDWFAAERLLMALDGSALEDLARQLAPEDADRILADVAELARTQDRERADQSLRAIIIDLATDRELVLERSPEQIPPRAPIPPELDEADEARLHDLYRTNRPALGALIRRLGRRPVVERFLLRLDRAALEDLAHQLAPEDADRILADVAELARTQDRERADQSLRAIIIDSASDRELVLERSPEQIPPRAPIPPGLDEADEARLHDLYRTNRPALVALVRRLRRRPVVERFLLRLDHAALEDLVRQLASENADQIAADVAELASIPSLTRRIDSSRALRHLWLMTADVQLRMPDRPYDRRVFVRAVLTAFAESEGRSVGDILEAIREDWTFQPDAESQAGPALLSLKSLVAEMIGDRSRELRSSIESRLPERAPARPGPMFSRYDRFEAVQYYIHYGVLPYSMSLLHPDLTVADALDVLADLPLHSLQALSIDLGRDARVRAWRRVVQQVPQDRLTDLIAALIEQTGLPAAPTWARLTAQVADATDKPLAYAQVIIGLLEGRRTEEPSQPAQVISMQEDVGSMREDVGFQPEDVGRMQQGVASSPWEGHRIKAVLSSRARGTAEAGLQEPTSLNLLLTLIELDADGARHFLRALKDAGLALSALLDEVPSESAVDTIQKLLAPDAANGLAQLRESVAALEPADRPADELVYSVIVTEILEQQAGSRALEAFLDTVRQQLAVASRAGIRHDHPAATSASRPSSARAAQAFSKEQQKETREWLQRLGVVSEAAAAPSLPADAIGHSLLRAIDDIPEVVHVALVERIGDRKIRDRWARELSEPELVRMAYVLEPRLYLVLMDAAELLFSAWLRAAPADHTWQTERSAFWSFVFSFLADTRTSRRSLDLLIVHFFDLFGAGERDTPTVRSGSEATTAQTIERLLDAAVERATAAGSAAVRAILDRSRAALIARGAASPRSSGDSERARPAVSQSGVAEPGAPPKPLRGRMAFSMPVDGVDEVAAGAEPIYIANAGLVLTNPFLPQWFRALDLLENPAGTGKTRLRPGGISRAVHLLQWLVDRSAATPEPLLCLNKLLCGAALATPVERRIEPTERELEVCQRLLKSMLANWTIISTTSIEGLQETFLQREGRLERSPGGWRLTVQRKTVDVLLDQIPWSISTIFHPWIPEPISVIW